MIIADLQIKPGVRIYLISLLGEFLCIHLLKDRFMQRGNNGMKLKKYRKDQVLLRLLISLFAVSISVAVISCGIVNTPGLFGEVRSQTVTEDKDAEMEEESRISVKKHLVTGVFYYNIWFEIWICILCMIFAAYMFCLPRGDTIVTWKVRMDD